MEMAEFALPIDGIAAVVLFHGAVADSTVL